MLQHIFYNPAQHIQRHIVISKTTHTTPGFRRFTTIKPCPSPTAAQQTMTKSLVTYQWQKQQDKIQTYKELAQFWAHMPATIKE
jgi:hypothetical protein